MNKEDIQLKKDLEESPIKTYASCFWTSLIETCAEKGLTEKDLERKFPGFYDLSLSHSEDEVFNKLREISNLEITLLKDSLSDIQLQLLELILQFRKEKQINSFNESKLQEYFAELLFKEPTTEIEIEKLKILSDVLKFIHEKEIEQSIADKRQKDYQHNFDRLMKYMDQVHIKEALLKYISSKIGDKQ